MVPRQAAAVAAPSLAGWSMMPGWFLMLCSTQRGTLHLDVRHSPASAGAHQAGGASAYLVCHPDGNATALCRVCSAWHIPDCRARALKDAERSALAAYLTLYKGQEKGMAKLGTGSAKHHPAVERALQQLKAHWVQVSACRLHQYSRQPCGWQNEPGPQGVWQQTSTTLIVAA